MLISYVLRLRPDALASGRFAGEIEAVSTRDRRSIRALDQVTSFIIETAPAQVETVGSSRARTDVLLGTELAATDRSATPGVELAAEAQS